MQQQQVRTQRASTVPVAAAQRAQKVPPRAVVQYQRLRGGESLRRPRATQGPHDAVLISARELGFMKQAARIETAADRRAVQSQKAATRILQIEQARRRKDDMLRMEEERRKRAAHPEDRPSEQYRNSLLAHANRTLDEGLDDVKHMTQLMAYAKCVTIRDQQLIEKKRLREQRILEERRLDAAMEAERIKALQMYEQRNREREEESRAGAKVIQFQIAERRRRRQREQEEREQEARNMVERVKQLEEKEEADRLRKKAAAKELLEQVMRANNAVARSKLVKKQEEIEEDARIVEYLKLKDLRDQQQEEELERVANEKELETARLRALQERVQDRQGEIDALRAKRYQEAQDRKWRNQRLQEAQLRNKVRAEIAEARVKQREEKELRLAEEAVQERDEYNRVLDWQRQQIDNDRRREEERTMQRNAYRSDLLEQIHAHENERNVARSRFLAEGDVVNRQRASEKAKLLAIRDRKLRELEQAGVPQKYRTTLARKTVLDADPLARARR